MVPAAMLDSKPITADADPPGPPTGESTEGRILVIDDDPAICRLLLMVLQRGGYKSVETARDARSPAP